MLTNDNVVSNMMPRAVFKRAVPFIFNILTNKLVMVNFAELH